MPTVRVGSWTDCRARTGCTVIVFDTLTPTVADVRGGAPGTRETDLLQPGRLVQKADAILLTGGSAFGLDAAGGVMQALREQGRGFPTSVMPVPIVPAAVLFDLDVGEPVTPGPDAGRAALTAARDLDAIERGQVGAGAGATTSKLWGPPAVQRGGLGYGRCNDAPLAVHAVAAVNAIGAVVDPSTGLDAITGAAPPSPRTLLQPAGGREATTLVSVIVESPCHESFLERLAVAAHDALARTIRPSHTLFDGDVVFVSGLQPGQPDPATLMQLSIAAEAAVEQAILDAVTA